MVLLISVRKITGGIMSSKNESNTHTPLNNKKIENNSQIYYKVKRLSDIIISILISPFLIIIIFVTSVFIKIDSDGPVFYHQTRIGENEKNFRIYKLRSMRNDAESTTGSVWAEKDDPRITRVGKFIRKVRIDELPQFLNVIKGDMSIVGPRPERPDLTEEFNLEIPGFKKRLMVKPGITGLAQINGGYDISPEEKLKYDLHYINNFGFTQDIKILFGTIRVVLTGHGSR